VSDTQLLGFYFSCNADKSANSQTIYVDRLSRTNVVLGARYKNCERNHLYEMEMDAEDLQKFGEMCIDLARQISS
jgi:hypothetical protein